MKDGTLADVALSVGLIKGVIGKGATLVALTEDSLTLERGDIHREGSDAGRERILALFLWLGILFLVCRFASERTKRAIAEADVIVFILGDRDMERKVETVNLAFFFRQLANGSFDNEGALGVVLLASYTDDEERGASTREGYVEEIEVVNHILDMLLEDIIIIDGVLERCGRGVVEWHDGELGEGFLFGLAPDYLSLLQFPVAIRDNDMRELQTLTLVDSHNPYAIAVGCFDSLLTNVVIPCFEEVFKYGGGVETEGVELVEEGGDIGTLPIAEGENAHYLLCHIVGGEHKELFLLMGEDILEQLNIGGRDAEEVILEHTMGDFVLRVSKHLHDAHDDANSWGGIETESLGRDDADALSLKIGGEGNGIAIASDEDSYIL
jgi:hypothetical protein